MLIDNTLFNFIFNLIYFCTACLVLVSSLSCEIKKDIFFQNKLGSYLVLFPLISMIFLIGLRDTSVGVDTNNYYNFFWLKDVSLDFGGEFLFTLLILIIKYFDLSFGYFLFIISCISIIFNFLALRKINSLYKSNLFICFFSSLSFFFFISMNTNIIRQGVSLSLLLFAYSLWVEKNNKNKILFFIALSLFFHSTSIIPIILFLISILFSKIKFNPTIILILAYFVSIFLSYSKFSLLNISPLILEVLGGDRRESYFMDKETNYSIGFKPQFVIFNTFFLILALYIKERLNDSFIKNEYNLLISYYIISSIIFFMAFQLPFSDRWGLFSWITIPFLVMPLFYSPFLKNGIKLHYIIMLIFIFIGFELYV